MLGGQDHGVHAHRLVVLVVLHGHLGLAVGAQVVHGPLLAHLGQALGHLVGQGDGQGHELRGLVTGIAEHHALVAGTVVQRAVSALFGLQGLVNAQGDVRALLVDVGDDAAGVAVKAVLGPVIADLPDDLAGDLGDVHVAAGADLPHDVDQARGRGGLAGHPAQGVLGQDGVQDGVGDLVANFIGMSLGNGLRSEKTVAHGNGSSLNDVLYIFIYIFTLNEMKRSGFSHSAAQPAR